MNRKKHPGLLSWTILMLITLLLGAGLHFMFLKKNGNAKQYHPTANTEKSANNDKKDTNVNTEITDIGMPADYFPMEVGSTWSYKVTIRNKVALSAKNVVWLIGETAMVQTMRGCIAKGSTNCEGNLTLRIKSKATLNELKLPYCSEGVEVSIVRDDFNIFDNTQKLFWVKTNNAKLTIEQIETFSPNGPGAPTGSYGVPIASIGYSEQMYFFEGDPGDGIRRNDSAIDSVILQKYVGKHMIFVRKVDSADKINSDLDKSFIDCFDFQKGIGLVQFEQQIGDDTIMRWELEDYKPGR